MQTENYQPHAIAESLQHQLEDLKTVLNIFQDLMEEKINEKDIKNNSEIQCVIRMIQETKENLVTKSDTAKLWLQYMQMNDFEKVSESRKDRKVGNAFACAKANVTLLWFCWSQQLYKVSLSLFTKNG